MLKLHIIYYILEMNALKWTTFGDKEEKKTDHQTKEMQNCRFISHKL